MTDSIQTEIDSVKKPREVTSIRLHPVLKKRLKKIAKKQKTTMGKLIEQYIIFGMS